MQRVLKMTDELASIAGTLSADDQEVFAAIREQLQILAGVLENMPAENCLNLSNVRMAATVAARSVEQLCLQDVNDATKSVEEFRRAVVDLQKITHLCVADVGGPCRAAATNTAGKPAAKSAPAPECRLSEEDLPLIREFVTEAIGHVDAAEACVLKLEDNPRDAEAIDAIFRGFHTIKGVAGFLHLQELGELAHGAENMLNHIRRGEGQWGGATIDLALDSIDLMKTMITALDESARLDTPVLKQEGLPALLEQLRGWSSGPSQTASLSPASSPSRPPIISTAVTAAAQSIKAPSPPSEVSAPPPSGPATRPLRSRQTVWTRW